MSNSDRENATATGADETIEELLGVRDAARILGVSPYTIYELVEARQISHVRVGRLIKFRRRDLAEFMDRNFNGVSV